MIALKAASRLGPIPRALAVLMLAGSLGFASQEAIAPAPVENPNHCQGKIEPPLRVSLDTGSPISVGANTIFAEIEFDETVSQAFLRITPLEGTTLLGPTVMALGAITAGETVPVTVPVSFAGTTRGGVQITAEAQGADGSVLYARREGLYALFSPSGPRVGRGGFLALEQRVALENIESGLLSPEQEAEVRAQASRFDAVASAAPPSYELFTPQQQTLNELIGAPRDGYVPMAVQGPSSVSLANITIEGTVLWTDENGTTHPAYGMSVDIYDEDTIIDEYLTTVFTDQSGNYQAVVNDDDGFLQGDRDIYVVIRAENSWIRCENMSNDVYKYTSSVYDETPGGSLINYSVTAGNTGSGPAISMFVGATWIAVYVAFDAGGLVPNKVNVEWPNGGTGSFYDGEVKMEQEDRWDWDTLHHEYGHYIMDQLNIEDNPGGAHNIGDCSANVRGNKSEGNRLAWGEGWPTYFGTSGQMEMNMAALNVPRVGDVSYQDLEDGNLIYSLETQDNNGRGEDNEVAVQRLLWDLYDNANDGRDLISRSDNSIWDTIRNNAGTPHILSNYWGHLRSGQSTATQLLMGEIASDHLIGPRLVTPAQGAVVSPSNLAFDWQGDVGCPSSYSGDSFDLKFYDANTLALLLTVPGIGSSNYNLTLAQLQGMIATTHNVLWAVEGRNSGSPATGPYLGENNAITLNTPPVADAGPDQPLVECTSPTTTSVQLNGTGSSDPDGDTITYLWSAPGVVFNDATSATPIGQFPKGTKVVTLKVSDGISEDTDQVSITVVDTTPPEITCPANIVVECTEHGGTPADDPQFAAFFAGVSATDDCDTTPTLGNDAPTPPALFPMGETMVTFTATDDDGNQSHCQAKVTVQDTTAPEITVVLNRYALWPPNHKMSVITASVEVTDICDPAPTFVLTSIVSNEPDNGLGDGDTPNDIQDAAYTSADTTFSLRSERSGNGSGRKYTIIYTASDMSGNTTPDTSCVRVSHDQAGSAMASSGFTAGGTWIHETATSMRMIIFSGSIDATAIQLDQAYIGNVLGVTLPTEHWVRDFNSDGLQDLVLGYSADDIRALRQVSKRSDPLGLHYTIAGTDYLVGDVFNLGSPLLVDVEAPGPQEKIIDGSAPDGENGTGMTVEEGILTVAEATAFAVEVFDVQGRRVRSMDMVLAAGRHELKWDGRDDSGRLSPTGIYFYRIQAPGQVFVNKILITR